MFIWLELVKLIFFDKKKLVFVLVEIKLVVFKIFIVDKLGVGGEVNVEVKKQDLLVVVDKLVLGVYVLGKFYIFVKVDILVLLFGSLVYCNVIEFYGIWFEVVIDVIDGFELGGISESKVVGVWSCLCKVDYEQLINDCICLKKEYQMNDWVFLMFIKQLGVQVCGVVKKDDVVFLQMFIFNKCGYKVCLFKINDKLKLLVVLVGIIFGIFYIIFKGVKYYVFEVDKDGLMVVYIYSQDFVNVKNLVCMDLSVVF